MKRFTMIFALILGTFSFGFGQVELFYDNDTHTGFEEFIIEQERVFAVHMSPAEACEVLVLKYYVKKEGASEGDFIPLLFPWEGTQPGIDTVYEQISVVITEGWKEVVVPNIAFVGDFVVGFLHIDPSAFLGIDADLDNDRAWILDNGIWTESDEAILIRAIVEYTATGVIEELEGTMINVYPNPASNVLNIDAGSDVQQVTLINPVGQVVYNTQLEADKTSIDLSGYSVGVYMVQFKGKDGTVLSTEKVIVK